MRKIKFRGKRDCEAADQIAGVIVMTNYDRIKNMTLDEMAKWLATKNTCDVCAYEAHAAYLLACFDEPGIERCIGGHKKWLEQEER